MEISTITIVHAGIFMADICFFIYLYKSYQNVQDLNDMVREQAECLKVGAQKFYNHLEKFHEKITESVEPSKKDKKDKK